MPAANKSPSSPITDSPLYWFAFLEKSADKQDFEEAARAVRELRRLGVKVDTARLFGKGREAAHA